ncbi:hypothetical protein HYC85_010499 [Camellia sinensis]|uniref:Uncharacterized protein n=1 Tax=Camellia sinensis TaxID=4442 RepID=A0A7J7HJ04_CAMSI|nr:hypothetical protein HYC85_010499 [Camellia sinensis]
MTFYSTGDLQTASETNIFLLKGYMVGNGVADSKFDGNALVPFAYGMGLISDDGSQHPSISQKIHGQSYFLSRISPNLRSRNTGLHNITGAYVNGGLQSPLPPTFKGTGLEFASPLSSVFVQAPAEKGFCSFMIDFLMGGVSAAVSKTDAAPIEETRMVSGSGLPGIWRQVLLPCHNAIATAASSAFCAKHHKKN